MMVTDSAEAPYPAYRAKLLRPDGSSETTVAIMAASDAEAVEQVQGLAYTYRVEVWDRGRMVMTVPFKPAR